LFCLLCFCDATPHSKAFSKRLHYDTKKAVEIMDFMRTGVFQKSCSATRKAAATHARQLFCTQLHKFEGALQTHPGTYNLMSNPPPAAGSSL
jgi:hypothetical protein